MRIITCFGLGKKGDFPYNCLGLSDADYSVSRTLHFLVYALTVVLHYFLTMPVGFNFNLTYGLRVCPWVHYAGLLPAI